jgi:lysophospholipase L1-like esterase
LRGLREYSYEKPSGVFRMVVHGDSFTWGLGVADSETYCSQLASRFPGSEVLNMGVNGHGIDQQYLYWLDEGSKYQPDMVILGYYIPDFHRNALPIREFPKPYFLLEDDRLALHGCPVPSPHDCVTGREVSLASRIRVVRLVAAAVRRMRSGESSESFDAKAALTREILRSWQESLAGSKTEFQLVIIPHPLLRRYPDHARIEEVLAQSAAENGFGLLNLTDRMQSLPEETLRSLYASNGHFSAAGHAYAARQIASFIRSAATIREATAGTPCNED